MSQQSRLEHVTQGIAQRITDGIYRPDQQLPTETELQAEWQVSRSVVREAMKILSSQGLVRIEQGRGTFVNQVSDAPLKSQLALALRWRTRAGAAAGSTMHDNWAHLIDVRSVLEVAVAEHAARHASASDIAAMQAAIDALREHPNRRAGYVDADIAFHRALAEATGNPLWPALLNSLNDLLRRYREEGFRGAPSALLAARQHEAILEAVRAGDAGAAVAAMREHLESSERDLLKRSDAPLNSDAALNGTAKNSRPHRNNIVAP